MTRAARVLLAEDSPFLCHLLSRYLRDAGGFEIAGTAHTGRDAVDMYRKLLPDAVALDLTFPDTNGVSVLREMMEVRWAPVVVITGASGIDSMDTLRALEVGAWDFVAKFDPASPRPAEDVRVEIVSKMRKAVHRARATPSPAAIAERFEWLIPNIAVVGASTGGPRALRELLAALPANFPGAIVVVQHMPARLSGHLAYDLSKICGLPVSEMQQGERLRPNTVHVVPGGSHIVLEAKGRVSFRDFRGEADCPSIDLAMESAAAAYGATATGILLSGMGSDGVRGITAIRQRGGFALVQDPLTCVVPGMPGNAISRGVADFVASPAELGRYLSKVVVAKKGGRYACAV